jgi:hypothetical protein
LLFAREAGVPLPMPSDVTLIEAGLLIGTGGLDPWFFVSPGWPGRPDALAADLRSILALGIDMTLIGAVVAGVLAVVRREDGRASCCATSGGRVGRSWTS